jgi:uncharacterized protein (DUF1501 family)
MISRRNFLKDSLAVVSLGVAVPSVFGSAIVAAAAEKNGSTSGKTLVVVQMAGGFDGLNTVVYYRDPAYRTNRPTLGVRDQDLLPIDDRVAFHPSLGGFKGLFEQGKLAVVEGVGYPNPNFSHFRAMDIWQSADPEGTPRNGWLGRYFDGLTDSEGHPLQGLAFGRSLPASLKADKTPVPALEDLATYGLQPAPGDKDPEKRQASLMRLYDIYRPAKSPFAALIDTTLDNASKSASDIAKAHAGYQPSVTYPQSSLASGLRLLAELIDNGGAQSPLRVGHVMLGGFDTHAQQAANLTRLLGETSAAVSAFWQDVVNHGHGDNVLVMTWSEFGRRVRENGNAGTDHGSAGPMFLIGNAVKGGFHGEPPSLTNLENGNLRFTTDFRSVYATVLERWLEAPSKDILGAQFDQLPLLSA